MGGPSNSVKRGCLWASLIFFGYMACIVAAGSFVVVSSWGGFWAAFEKYVLVFVSALVLLLPVALLCIYFTVKDPDARKTWSVNWPIVLSLIYFISPDLIPGPIDDVLLGLLAVWWRTRLSRKVREEAQLPAAVTPSVTPPALGPRGE